jgi:hypothetical protein
MIQQYPYHVCMQYVNRYVKLQTTDGQVYEGVIAHVENDRVILAIPEDKAMPDHRFFGVPPFGFGGFFPGFRFRPFGFPFGGIGGIFPFSFFI